MGFKNLKEDLADLFGELSEWEARDFGSALLASAEVTLARRKAKVAYVKDRRKRDPRVRPKEKEACSFKQKGLIFKSKGYLC